jgi:Bacteriophage Sf6, terminase small subunit-like
MAKGKRFTQQLADAICNRMASGESLRQICKDGSMPALSTVLKWVSERPDFEAKYTQARERLMEYWAEEIIEICDDGTNDWIEREAKDGSKYSVFDHEHVQRSRLRVDSRKWLMSKMLPRKYGDKVAVTGSDGGPLQVTLNDPTRED